MAQRQKDKIPNIPQSVHMMKRTSLAAALLICLTLPGCSAVIPAPIDGPTVALVGNRTYFNCTLSTKPSEPPDWYHYSVGAEPHQKNFIYAHRQFYPLYRKGFWLEIDASSGMHSLVIESVEVGYAGRYECCDSKHNRIKSSKELTVLESTPNCDSNIRPDGVMGSNSCDIEPEKLELSCTVLYYGNIPPAMIWKISGDDSAITTGLTITNDMLYKSVSYNLRITADYYLNGSHFICQTTQSKIAQHSCKTNTVKVMHVLGNDLIVQKATGNNITCYVNSSQYCNYTWSHYTNDNSLEEYKGRVLITTSPGEYECKAHCKIRDDCCTVKAMKLHVTSDNPSTQHVGADLRTCLSITIPIVMLAVVLAVVFAIYMICIRNKSTSTDAIEESKAGQPLKVQDGHNRKKRKYFS